MNRKESELAYSVAEESGGIFGGTPSLAMHDYLIIKACYAVIVGARPAGEYDMMLFVTAIDSDAKK